MLVKCFPKNNDVIDIDEACQLTPDLLTAGSVLRSPNGITLNSNRHCCVQKAVSLGHLDPPQPANICSSNQASKTTLIPKEYPRRHLPLEVGMHPSLSPHLSCDNLCKT